MEEGPGYTDDESSPLAVTVKTVNETGAAWVIHATEAWTVGRLRATVALHMAKDPQFLRLIHGGRLLADDSLTLGIALVQAMNGAAAVHCAVSERAHHTAVRVERDRVVGFARLREAGFTEEEVEDLRQQFRHTHGPNATAQEEEAWLGDGIAAAAPLAQQRGSTVDQLLMDNTGGGSIYDRIALGAVCGFVMPFSVVWARRFHEHARAGLVLGVCCNVAFWLCRVLFF